MENHLHSSKKMTIYDIARMANTSTATVSRVLSNSNYPVSPELKQRILDTANKLNYSPNVIGRMLKKRESKDIGVIIPTISNPFFPKMILGIEVEARKHGYSVFLCNSFRNAQTEEDYLNALYQKQVGGVILSSVGKNRKQLEMMKKNGVKIVLFDDRTGDFPCSRVGFDYTKGGYLAVQHLINMGHRNIAFLSSPLSRSSRKEVFEGYKMALLDYHIEPSPKNILISLQEEETTGEAFEYENGKRLVEDYLRIPDRPTAIFTVNDMTAFGVIQELSNHSLRVPEDVSVMGFDNIDISSMLNPPLTTINQPAFETGTLACHLLLNSMGPEPENPISTVLEPSLVERKSVIRTL